jgi:hypothetical protein
VIDSNNIIYFEEWAPTVVCFINRMNSYLNDLIEIYENDSVVLIWVRGKGVISKKSFVKKKIMSQQLLHLLTTIKNLKMLLEKK